MSQKTIIIKVPEVASITITGPTQCGKSIIMDRIKKMLEKEFGATVISKDLENEKIISDYQNLAKWETDMVAETIWHISEFGMGEKND